MFTGLPDLSLGSMGGCLVDDEHLLVLHVVPVVVGVQDGLDVVLHLRSGLRVVSVRRLVEEGGGHARRQQEREGDQVVAWHQSRYSECEAGGSEVEELLLESALDIDPLLPALMLLELMVHEAALLLALHFDLHVPGLNWLSHSQEDVTLHHLPWVVHRLLSLNH